MQVWLTDPHTADDIKLRPMGQLPSPSVVKVASQVCDNFCHNCSSTALLDTFHEYFKDFSPSFLFFHSFASNVSKISACCSDFSLFCFKSSKISLCLSKFSFFASTLQ